MQPCLLPMSLRHMPCALLIGSLCTTYGRRTSLCAQLVGLSRWTGELRCVYNCFRGPIHLIEIEHQRLKKVLLEDQLGICSDLEHEMDDLVGTFRDEWSVVTNDPEKQKQFRQFVNTVSRHLADFSRQSRIVDVSHQDERVMQVEQVSERGQSRPAYWPKTSSAVHLREDQIQTPKDQWKWRTLAKIADLSPTDAGTTYVFYVFALGWYPTKTFLDLQL